MLIVLYYIYSVLHLNVGSQGILLYMMFYLSALALKRYNTIYTGLPLGVGSQGILLYIGSTGLPLGVGSQKVYYYIYWFTSRGWLSRYKVISIILLYILVFLSALALKKYTTIYTGLPLGVGSQGIKLIVLYCIYCFTSRRWLSRYTTI